MSQTGHVTGRTRNCTKALYATLVLLCFVSCLLPGCGKPTREPSDKMLVAASIAPLADFARQVGGDLVDVELLVPPGANPHTYQVEPAQMETLSKASVLILNGVELEFWAKNAVDAAGNARLIVVESADGLKILGHGDEAHGETGNPHVWLDPMNAIYQVKKIRNALVKADPKHAAQYHANADAYTDRLNKLDADIGSQVAKWRSKSFVSFHPTWVYFAGRYGLTEAATIEESPGKEPSPKVIRHAVDVARELNAKAVFTEPQMSPKAAQVVAEEAGAKVLLLDAFGKPPDYSYIETMQSNVKTMSEALR